ncbi:MAG: hypothetical protein K0R24_423 [Gammaproteobacteria bacterium]|jgi:hypothetical protein|nr:hypothetical protein [Gammaproteobacteria bacterium]
MQNESHIVDTIKPLVQYEIDSTFILAQAISCLSDKTLRDKLSEFREECENNIKTLSEILVDHGGEAPEHTRDFKGFFMQGYTGMRGLISDEGAMKALATNTRMLVDAFRDALKGENMPLDVREKVKKVLNNAEEHLKYFESETKN